MPMALTTATARQSPFYTGEKFCTVYKFIENIPDGMDVLLKDPTPHVKSKYMAHTQWWWLMVVKEYF